MEPEKKNTTLFNQRKPDKNQNKIPNVSVSLYWTVIQIV